MKSSRPGRVHDAVVAGAGPAGLTAALELVERGVHPLLIEADYQVGGISKTVEHSGYRFDLGGHRFFTKEKRIRDIWAVLAGDDFIKRKRLSRIYYKDRFFDYPLKAGNVLWNLGLGEGVRLLASYVHAIPSKRKREASFEDYIINRFGERLYNTFFKSYTEKVWGIPCTSISADWAAQRIKGLSLTGILKNAFFGGAGAKSLIQEFHYPRHGPGQVWRNAAERIVAADCVIQLRSKIEGVDVSGENVVLIVDSIGEKKLVEAKHFFSSMPLQDLILNIRPKPPKDVLKAAENLRYRDFLTVALIIDETGLWPDQWIYVHDPAYSVGRIQNYGNWSPDMVKPGKSCVGMEYFCFEGDDLWNAPDEEIRDKAVRELNMMGLLKDRSLVCDFKVLRVEKAYPIYDENYRESVETIKEYLDGIPRITSMGRNGLHRYNNMDHSMMTAILAVENMFGAKHDVWKVNADAEYHETREKTG